MVGNRDEGVVIWNGEEIPRVGAEARFGNLVIVDREVEIGAR
ncbi:MAG: hypothetical protein R2849_16920 [Thermomicrobiales bacterium]